jgi:hypothetical protein
MRIEKLKPCKASNASSFLAGSMTHIMYLFSAVLLLCSLTSCQSGYYPHEHSQYQAQRQFALVQQPAMRFRAVKSSSVQNVGKTDGKSKGLPKFQSTYVDPPTPKSGYHARLDTTKYQSMGYMPYYRVLSPTQRWNMPEKAFWEWYTPAQKRGWKYIKIFDPYSTTAPPSK